MIRFQKNTYLKVLKVLILQNSTVSTVSWSESELAKSWSRNRTQIILISDPQHRFSNYFDSLKVPPPLKIVRKNLLYESWMTWGRTLVFNQKKFFLRGVDDKTCFMELGWYEAKPWFGTWAWAVELAAAAWPPAQHPPSPSPPWTGTWCGTSGHKLKQHNFQEKVLKRVNSLGEDVT